MSDVETTGGPAGRQISKIQFPYIALDDAIGLARQLLEAGGVPMDRDQLAAAIGTAPTGGMFAVKLSALRMFGLVAPDASGRLSLTERGFDILDPERERAAKIDAFLSVELFRAVYEQFKGRQLPPRPIGLEQALVSLGVSSKQKDRARVTLDRSARLAGFFPASGEDRLVMPLDVPKKRVASELVIIPPLLDDTRQPDEHLNLPVKNSNHQRLDGVILALIDKLPSAGNPFSSEDRKKWLAMMGMAFDMAYVEPPPHHDL